MNTTTTHDMKFQHVDSMTTNMITIQGDINSPTISLTTPLTINNTEELTAIMTGGNVQTPPKDKKPITITIPKMDTPTILCEEDTLPDLTEIEAIEKEANETSANMVDISDDEPTFLDKQVTVSTNNSNDVIIVYTEPSPVLQFSPTKFCIKGRVWTPGTYPQLWYYPIYKHWSGINWRTQECREGAPKPKWPYI